MAIPYTIVFYQGDLEIGTTQGTFSDDIDSQSGANGLYAYFQSGGLAISALKVEDWTRLTVTVNEQNFNYNR
jgi:hypothetical protein